MPTLSILKMSCPYPPPSEATNPASVVPPRTTTNDRGTAKTTRGRFSSMDDEVEAIRSRFLEKVNSVKKSTDEKDSEIKALKQQANRDRKREKKMVLGKNHEIQQLKEQHKTIIDNKNEEIQKLKAALAAAEEEVKNLRLLGSWLSDEMKVVVNKST